MSVMDLLKDLKADSVSDEWHRLYLKEVVRGNTFFERLSDTDCKLTICESQRAGLIGQLLNACTLLEAHWPDTAAYMRRTIAHMETEYAKPLPPLKSFGKAAGDTQHPHGPAKPADAAQVQPLGGDAPYIDLPARVRQQLWDQSPSKTG
jgi:hypothetical protein